MKGNATYDPLLGDIEAPAQTDAGQESPATDATTSLSSEVIRNAELALNLRDNAAAGWLYWVTNSTLGEQIGPDAFLVFRKLLLEEAGDPSDPIERMLVEQMALAHFSIGQLRIRSCTTDLPKMALAFSDSATRLLGEFRRCSLALEEYRSKRAIRTEKRSSTDVIEKQTGPKSNGHAKPSANGNGRHGNVEVGSNGNGKHLVTEANGNGDIPTWLKQRMAYPIPNGSQPAAATASNGEA
jgi:hypothetical protein